MSAQDPERFTIMKLVDSSDKKVKKICDVLVRETLEPAQKRASEILEDAKQNAKKIIETAHQQAQAALLDAEEEIKEKNRTFESSLKVAAQKAMTALREQMTHQLFSQELREQIHAHLSQKDIVVRLIDALIASLENEGASAPFAVIVSKAFSPEEICSAILQTTQDKLKGKSVELGNISGVEIKCEDQTFSIEITENAIQELLSRYAQDSLRKILFNL